MYNQRKYFSFLQHTILPLLILILFFVGLSRFCTLDNQSLWLDEAYFIVKSSPSLFSLCKDCAVHTFYQFNSIPSSTLLSCKLLYYWTQFFGKSEFMVRLPFALFGILSVVLLYYLAKFFFNRQVAIFASLLMAVSPIHVYYSQEAKIFIVLCFLFIGALFLFGLAVRKKRYLFWNVYLVFMGVWIYFSSMFHVPLVFVVAASHCIIIFYFNFVQRKSQTIYVIGIIGVYIVLKCMLIPWNLIAQANFWIRPAEFLDFASTLTYYSFLSWRLPLTRFVLLAFALSVPLYCYLFIKAFLYLSGGKSVDNHQRKNLLLCFFSLLIPLGMLFVISYLFKPVYVAGRTDFLFLPAFFLVVAFGLGLVRSQAMKVCIVAALIVSQVLSLHSFYFVYNKSNDREIAQYIQSEIEPDDIIVATEMSLFPLCFYWSKNFVVKTFPFPRAAAAGYINKEILYGEKQYIENEIISLRTALYPLLNRDNRLFFLHVPNQFSEECVVSLEADLQKVKGITFSPGHNDNQVHEVIVFRK